MSRNSPESAFPSNKRRASGCWHDKFLDKMRLCATIHPCLPIVPAAGFVTSTPWNAGTGATVASLHCQEQLICTSLVFWRCPHTLVGPILRVSLSRACESRGAPPWVPDAVWSYWRLVQQGKGGYPMESRTWLDGEESNGLECPSTTYETAAPFGKGADTTTLMQES